MMNANPSNGNFLRGLDVLSLLSRFLFLRKEQTHCDITLEYNCWLHGPVYMGEKGNGCIFSSFTDNKQ
jgi:hypothetical protein